MKIKKRLVIESIIVSAVILFIYYGFRMVQGYMLAKNNVPDVLDRYENIEVLQSNVSFGVQPHFHWLSLVFFLLTAVIYYALRSWIWSLARAK